MKKRVLIAGGTGFLGRNLVEYFASRDEFSVFATYREQAPFPSKNVSWIRADLRNRAAAERAVEGVDLLVQAAATTSGAGGVFQEPHFHVTDNAVMNALLFRAAYQAKVKQVLFFSCS